MSQASQSLTLTRIRNGMSYAGMLTVNMGDLWQDYDATSVKPDFTTDATKQPVVTLMCFTGEGSIPSTITVYWDEVPLSFNSLAAGNTNLVSSNLAAGVIKIEQQGNPSSGAKWMLRFVKNVAVAGTGVQASHTLRVVGEFPSGNKVTAVKGFSIGELTQSGESVHIQPGASDAMPFTVDQDAANSQCTLVAQYYKGGDPSTAAGATYQWYKQDVTATSGWTALSGKTQQTLTVTKDDVDTYAMYKVELTTQAGEKLTDTQSVMDIGDPFEVAIAVKDQSGAVASPSMNGDVGATEARWFTASLISRKGGTVPPITDCRWLVTNPAGVTLNGGTAKIGDMVASGMNTANLTGTDLNTIKISAAWLDQQGLQSVRVTATVTF